MKNALAIVIVLAVTSTIFADKLVIQLSPTEGLLVESSAPITIERVPIQNIGTPIVVNPPVDPSLTFQQASKKAMDAIPDYALKQQDRQAMAFTLTFMAKVIPDDDKTIDAFILLKQACDSATGSNASKWAGWWTVVGRYTAGCTNTECKAFVADMSEWLKEGIAAAENSEPVTYSGPPIGGMSEATINAHLEGVDTFGLDTEFIAQLMKLLLPLLLQLLQQLFTPS